MKMQSDYETLRTDSQAKLKELQQTVSHLEAENKALTLTLDEQKA